jgi:hypothetical protein
MTTTVTPGQPTRNPLRPVLIAANLLPPEIIDARRNRRARRLTLAALLLLVVSIGAWYGLVTYQTGMARDEQTAAEDEALRLTAQQRSYKGVVDTQAESAALRTELGALLADDLRWSQLLSSLRAAAPAQLRVRTMVGAVAERVEGEAPAANPAGQLPSTAKDKSIGTITITGTGTTKGQVAEYVDTLATVPGVTDPYLISATVLDGAVDFTVRLDITAAALGGRFAAPTPAPSAAPPDGQAAPRPQGTPAETGGP